MSNNSRGKKTKFGFNPETGEYFDEEFDNFQIETNTFGDDDMYIDIEEDDYEY